MQPNPPTLIHPAYRPDIDGLRACAVLVVVVFHAFPSVLKGGFIGVDVFFVISGFLISSIIFDKLNRNRFSFLEFYSRRIRRIFPALLVVLVACYAMGWLVLTAPDFTRLGRHIVGGAGFVSNFILLKESGYFDAAAEVKQLLHLWSLAIEEQFYIVWPLLAWCAWKLRCNLLIMTLIAGVAGFILTIRISHDQAEIAKLYYSPITRFWELLIGAMLASFSSCRAFEKIKYLIEKMRASMGVSASGCANVRSFTGAGLLTLAVFIITKDKPFPGWYALFPTCGTALIISAGAKAWINQNILANRVLVWIGLISFPLYLWHWPLLSFARVIQADAPLVSTRIALLVVSVALAWLTKTYIENPIRFDTTSNYSAAILVVAMSAVGSVGYFTYANEGLPQRYGVAELKMEPGRYECPEMKKNSGCAFGNPDSDRLVVVWGDSHAEQYTNALRIALGNDYRFIAITNGSCFMGEKIVFPDIGSQRDCSAAIDKLKSLHGLPIYAVIRAQRWHGYGIWLKNDVKQAIDDAITAYDLQPQKIIIMGATPDVDIECALSNYFARPSARKKICKPVDEIKMFIKDFIATANAMSVPSNVYFIHPFETACPNNACAVIKDHVAYFEDIHHLTLDGALQIMPAIARALSEDAQ